MLELRVDRLAQKRGHQLPEFRLGHIVVARTFGFADEADRADLFQHFDPLADRSFAQIEFSPDVTEAQRLGRGKEESIDFAIRAGQANHTQEIRKDGAHPPLEFGQRPRLGRLLNNGKSGWIGHWSRSNGGFPFVVQYKMNQRAAKDVKSGGRHEELVVSRL